MELRALAARQVHIGTDMYAFHAREDKFGTVLCAFASVLPASNGMELPVLPPVPQVRRFSTEFVLVLQVITCQTEYAS
jgi:hypothetical protein